MTLHEFTVSGRGSFPIDMLRYDQCWPKHESSDVSLVVSSIRDRGTQMISVTLLGTRTPTVARWRSFGWTVLE